MRSREEDRHLEIFAFSSKAGPGPGFSYVFLFCVRCSEDNHTLELEVFYPLEGGEAAGGQLWKD